MYNISTKRRSLLPSPSSSNNNNDSNSNNDNQNNTDLSLTIALEKKINLAVEDFNTDKFYELILRDRNRLSNENALTICDYVITMKREVNPRLNSKKYTIQFLAELSKTVGIEKKFIDMTREDVLLYLDVSQARKPRPIAQ